MSNSWAQEVDSNDLKHEKPKVQIPEWINQMVNDTGSSAKPRFLFYPTIGFSPETRWEFGASSLVVFHYNNDTSLRPMYQHNYTTGSRYNGNATAANNDKTLSGGTYNF
jgi:hypothetical protein